MRGFVPTPESVVDQMVARLFAVRLPRPDDRVLDPGCGEGEFIAGVLRWCASEGVIPPHIIGIELDRGRAAHARARFSEVEQVEIREEDFLGTSTGCWQYIVGNPPYVGITQLAGDEKADYRRRFVSARGRFDLYLLFFEQALRQLAPGGRLVFVTPEKYLFVETARPLRQLLSELDVESIDLIPEETFAPLVTYPAVTVLNATPPEGPTTVKRRDGRMVEVEWPQAGESLQPQVQGGVFAHTGFKLEDICLRVSAGVATGADAVYIRPAASVPDLRAWAMPTLSGRELLGQGPPLRTHDVMLTPYDSTGRLLPLADLGRFGDYLKAHHDRLVARTCARRKPWYSFHENPPLQDILRPKILCRDISAEPLFWPDTEGRIVPGHSVYYIVPFDPAHVLPLTQWLNGEVAASWLRAHCQRAANGYLRLQSAVLRRVPTPAEYANRAVARAS